MTPAELRLLLRIYYIPELPVLDTPALQNGIKTLLRIELIRACEEAGCYDCTKKGDVYVKLLCNTPLPTQVWVDQNGKVIND